MQQNEPRNKRRKEARPQEILQAALTLFVEKGYAAAKMEDIARAAGVTRGTPYLYFANKEEIFKALIREMLLPKIELGESMLESHHGSVRDLLVEIMETWWTQMGETPLSALPKLIMTEAGNFPDVAEHYREAYVERGIGMIAEVLARGVRNGEFRPVDTGMLAHVIAAPVIMLMIYGNCPGSRGMDVKEPRRYIAATIDLVLNGLMTEKK